MNGVRSRAKSMRMKESVDTWPAYRSLSIGLLVYILALTVPSAVKAAVFNVAAGDVYGPNGLVAAIRTANSNGERNQIVLEPGGTYTLTRVDNDTDGPNGLPSITSVMTISNGTLARTSPAIIERKSDAADVFRILHVSSGGTLGLINVVVRGGKGEVVGAGRFEGAGLFNRGRITVLINSVVSDNVIECTFRQGEVTVGRGGGIFNSDNGGFLPGILVLGSSTISRNVACTGGGGIYNQGNLTINDSTISSNMNGISGGGGFTNASGRATLENSTVNANSSGGGGGGRGGGINNLAGTLTVTNSTISDNEQLSGNGRGGGIHNSNSGTVHLSNVTITNNRVQLEGGGIFNASGSTVNLKHTILAGNCRNEREECAPLRGIPDDCSGALTSQGFNLLGRSTNCNFMRSSDDDPELIGPATPGADPVNPLLGPLQDNGGLTMTHALLVNVIDRFGNRLDSPAIDSGGTACLATDQRRFRRPIDGPDADTTATCDIGAFEFGMRVVNDAFSEPTRSNPTTSRDIAGCPRGFFGKFRFNARFTNASINSLSDLLVEVQTITNGNVLQNADGGPGGVKARLTVPRRGGFSDGLLRRGEFVNIPFIICLRKNEPFTFVVDVFGMER